MPRIFCYMEEKQIRGLKKKMTQVFEADGTVIPVTTVLVDIDTAWDELTTGLAVTVTGISKGKGFAGGVKRYSFAGGPKTRGQSDRHRAIGSIGSGTFPGKVWKGKKMPGRMGHEKVTVKGLRIVQVAPADRLIYVSGAIPGGPNSEVVLRVAVSQEEATQE